MYEFPRKARQVKVSVVPADSSKRPSPSAGASPLSFWPI
jgi:hypothetical protein